MPTYDKVKMQAQAEAWAKYWWNRALKRWPKIGTMPLIEMNARLTATAGRAFIENKPAKCDFSCYFMATNPEVVYKEIIPHELAHHIAWRLYKEGNHGKVWKGIAIELYGKNDTYHSMSYVKRR